MQIKEFSLQELRPYEKNPRKNDAAVEKVANSIKTFGFKVPLVIDTDNVIVCGHTRFKAAQKLGLNKVPCVVADDLSPELIKAFRLADNKVAELSYWDFEKLGFELDELKNVGLDLSVLGFDLPHVDVNDFFEEVETKKIKPEKAKSEEPETQKFSTEQANENYKNFEDIANKKKIIICPHCGKEIEL